MSAAAIPTVIIAALLLVTAVGLLIAAVLRRPRPKPTAAQAWATTNGLELTDATVAPIELYLRNSASLRRIGAVGGLVVPAAVTAGTGLDLHIAGIVWILLGYLIGVVVAELALARVPADGRRAASLDVRRLRDYLPRPLLLAQIALPVVALGLSMVIHPVQTAAIDLDNTAQDVAAGAVAAGILIALVMPFVLLGERRLVGRPQPLAAPELVALDDAMRSSSVRRVAATSVAISAFVLTNQFTALAYDLSGTALQPALLASAFALMVFAYVSWQWWVNRGWRVRRPAPPPVRAPS